MFRFFFFRACFAFLQKAYSYERFAFPFLGSWHRTGSWNLRREYPAGVHLLRGDGGPPPFGELFLLSLTARKKKTPWFMGGSSWAIGGVHFNLCLFIHIMHSNTKQFPIVDILLFPAFVAYSTFCGITSDLCGEREHSQLRIRASDAMMFWVATRNHARCSFHG